MVQESESIKAPKAPGELFAQQLRIQYGRHRACHRHTFSTILVYDHEVPIVICFGVWGIQFWCYFNDLINICSDIM